MQKTKRAFFFVYIVAIHLALVYFLGEKILLAYTYVEPLSTKTSVADPTTSGSIPSPSPVPELFADQVIETVSPVPEQTNLHTPGLVIPVVGVKPEQLLDTFSSSRSEGRFHDAIDIPATAGTPVVAATDGEIVRFFDSERGGITIYQLSSDRRYVLYYAHLQRRADSVHVGMTVAKGATIGFVGDSGNSGTGNFHLHFSIALVTDPKRFWEGSYINPYPILKNGLNLPTA